ncbi:MAG: NUDIX hydrolase [Clostridiales bacterium]|nr:NUDIX hydrolase [Clostridiales bacterium]
MDRLDKNGKTEEQFLRDYDVTQYFRPSVTVDAVLCAAKPSGVRVLMIERGGHPFIGRYAFPGGFVESDEDCESAAARELYEETGVKGVPLRQLVTASSPKRDPRWRNITVIFYAVVDGDIAAVGGDDAVNAVWFDVKCSSAGSEGKERAKLEFSADNESFSAELDIVRDSFGKVDLNKTRIVDCGKTAFDHAVVLFYLYELLRGGK